MQSGSDFLVCFSISYFCISYLFESTFFLEFMDIINVVDVQIVKFDLAGMDCIKIQLSGACKRF